MPPTGSIQRGVTVSESLRRAPWTTEQVAALNRWQAGPMHPFTCFNWGDGSHRWATDLGVLVATEQGWVCPDCNYTQDWAHEFMLDGGL